MSPPAPRPVPDEAPVPDPVAGAWTGLLLVLTGFGAAAFNAVSLAGHGIWLRAAEVLEVTGGRGPGDPDPPRQWVRWLESHGDLAEGSTRVALFDGGGGLLLGLVVAAFGVGVIARWDACRKAAQVVLACKALAVLAGLLVALLVILPETSELSRETVRILRDLPGVAGEVDLRTFDTLASSSYVWTILVGGLGIAIPLLCLFLLRRPAVRAWCVEANDLPG